MEVTMRRYYHHPLAPNWRHLRARLLADVLTMKPRRGDDKLIRAQRLLLKRLKRCKPASRRQQTLLQTPVGQAFLLYALPSKRRSRWAIEARILANQPRADMARRCAVKIEVIEAYEQLYFDVRDCLDAPDYIHCTAIGRMNRDGWSKQPLEILWKLVGYVGGPRLLDVLINGANDPDARAALQRLLQERDHGADTIWLLLEAYDLDETSKSAKKKLKSLNAQAKRLNRRREALARLHDGVPLESVLAAMRAPMNTAGSGTAGSGVDEPAARTASGPEELEKHVAGTAATSRAS